MDMQYLTDALLVMETLSLILIGFFIKALFKKMLIFKNQLEIITNDHTQLTSGFNALYHSIDHMEKSFKKVKEGQDGQETRENPKYVNKKNHATMDYASKLIEMGASMNDVKKSCQLNSQEAELVWAVNKKSAE